MPPAPDRSGAPVVVYARELDAGRNDIGVARGEVELFRADQHMMTELIRYDPQTEQVTFPGRVAYEDQQVWLRGEEADYSFLEETGSFSLIDYGLTGSSANGSARRVELIGGHTSMLYDLDYTTCPDERPDWQIQARELELQHEEGMGVARGARLEFKGVPILYAPWFTFPIDDRRKSGFLYPSLGQASDSGFEFGIPWYWNIAPNQDMTLEPRYFTKRGFMLSGEYRLMTRRTFGRLEWDYLPDDRKTGEERWYYLLNHAARPWKRWRTELVFERVSDNAYFEDFGTSLSQTSRQFLRSSGALYGVGRYWNFELMADDFQVIDESVLPVNEPYRRVPRIAFWLDRPLGMNGLFAGLDSEVVYFDRDVGAIGARVDLYPRLYWDRYQNWGFFRPSVGYRYTAYDLDRRGIPGDESPDRGTLIASLDTGLHFERTTAAGDLQTLEPRAFYLYVPYRDQTGLPSFDTGEFTFGFSQLFSTNRFAGADRQGDANQLSLAVSTHRYDGSSGNAVWSLSLGQIIYFEEQRVQLNGDEPSDDDFSPFLGEFTWHVSRRLSALAGLQWDWDRSRLDVGSLGLRYRGDRGQRAEFEYRFRRDRVDQFDFRIFWPINQQWRALSRVNYSFADDDLLEIQGGLEYESCCWALRTVLRRYLKNREGEYRNGIFVELNLKGLSSIGTRGRELFRD
ncbi:MAG: LPS assembly protein LptD [Xanthomonadales bacterium]|nr:LPS assembly protein LptD [Xanthomonadales bacterium]